MTIPSTERACAMRPHRTGLRPTSGAWAASAVAALVAVVAMLAVPHEAAAKYGSPLVTHVATAGGRGGVYLVAHPERATTHRSAPTLHADASTGRPTAPFGDRRGTTRLGSHSDLGNGIVLARSARPVPQIAVVQSELVLAERTDGIAASGFSRADEFQHAAGPAHRLRGPPTLLA